MQSLEMRGSTVNEKSSGLHSCYAFSNSGVLPPEIFLN